MMCHRERSEAISYSIAGAGNYEQAGPKKVTLRPYNIYKIGICGIDRVDLVYN